MGKILNITQIENSLAIRCRKKEPSSPIRQYGVIKKIEFEIEIEIEGNAQQPDWTSISILENM